ncbi:glycoside hydrolase family 28 protein [Amycolatopsis australiensis]|uniref:Glycosyl hydrolases family 28 n=1 Tax=Amycolatopsis australiensis TaxID=546364 RepID=A0A1K1QZZ5_9PSEU|nr:glycoside hydrolase family 28 protein [Amycolatopsis australiensis]SFW65349.1 Glycosyl hydrolases family 28 [Amycolatopsis australiensis]
MPWIRRRTGSFTRRKASTDGRFTRRQLIKGTLAVSLVPALPAPPARRYRVDVPVLPWPAANDIVANTTIPTFPDRSFPITGYGAKSDGKTDNTAAIGKAIDACAAAGGGHVIVPSGGSFLTGAIHLKSNVDLHLEPGAVLTFSGDASKYPNVLTRYEGIECVNRSPMIYAYGQKNIGLTGKGTLDAAATSSWNKGSDRAYLETLVAKGTPPDKRVVPGSGHTMRSAFVEPYACENVLIQGVTLKNPMFWQLHPTLCRNVTVDGVTTDPSTAHSNTDGCDPESCDHVVIANCVLGAHDDNIAIKSGRDADGRRVNVPCQNLVVVNCVMNGNWGAITCGSEQTGGIRNVYAYRLTVKGDTKFALYVKSNTLRGGFSENINLDSVSGTFARAFVYVTSTYNSQTGGYAPSFGPFTISNCASTKVAGKTFDVSGLPNAHVHGLAVTNCAFAGVSDTSNTLKYVDNARFTNVTVNGRPI